MSFKRFRTFVLVPVFFILSALLFAFLTARYNSRLAVVEVCGIAAMSLVYIVWAFVVRKDFVRLVLSVSSKVDFSKKRSLVSFPMPVVITNSVGDVELFNPLFSAVATDSRELERGNISDFTSGVALEELLSCQGLSVRYGDRYFSVYSGETKYKDRTFYIFYFLDDTELKAVSAEYRLSRPSVILVSIDGAEEIQGNFSSNDYAEIRLNVDKSISEWSGEHNCICHKTGGDRYIMVVEERGLLNMISSRFRILDDIRGYKFNDKTVGLTLSMGVGHGDTLPECEENARQALDMAQSRGGDQTAIKKSDASYEFFGGISKGVEKKTKVKTRIMASAISELIKASSDVMIMGHRFPDLDALGAAVGLCPSVAAMGKRVSIVTDKNRSLAQPLLERMIEEGKSGLLEEPSAALQRITKKTLLIVVDTHTVDFVESTELLSKASSVIVIDHHRKSVNFINNAVLFFHDPGASSASEMVTELNSELAGFGTTNHPGATGDGIVMATKIGAATTQMEEIQTHPTVVPTNGYMITEAVRGNGAIIVNRDGKRFTNEMGTRDVVSEAILEQEKETAYLFFDDSVRESLSAIDGYIKMGLTTEGESIEEIAAALEISAENLKLTIDSYNTYVDAQEDTEFARPDMPRKLEKAKYYAIEIGPAIHHTMGGLKINTNAEVLNTSGDAINGLFAAGEVTGGVHGGNRLGGNAVADIIVFGRIAGKTAAEFIK